MWVFSYKHQRLSENMLRSKTQSEFYLESSRFPKLAFQSVVIRLKRAEYNWSSNFLMFLVHFRCIKTLSLQCNGFYVLWMWLLSQLVLFYLQLTYSANYQSIKHPGSPCSCILVCIRRVISAPFLDGSPRTSREWNCLCMWFSFATAQ